MRLLYPVVAVVLVVALMLGISLFSSSREDFSTYNDGWNGCSRLKQIAQDQHYSTVGLFSLNDVGDKQNGVLFMINPAKSAPISKDDVSSVKAFVQNGGTLVLANDVGNANVLLNGLGLANSVKFNGSLLRDNASYWAGTACPLIAKFSPSNVTDGVRMLYFNYGTALDLQANTSVPIKTLAVSGRESYLGDVPDTQGQLFANSSGMGPEPVLVSLAYGKGAILLLSDPSVLVNSMLDKGDNQKLFENIVKSGGGVAVPVYFDESHRTVQPMWAVAYSRINADDTLKYASVVGILGLTLGGFGVYVLADTRARQRRSVSDMPQSPVSLDEGAIVEDIIARHPRWRQSRVKKLLKINAKTGDEDTDE